MAAHRRAEHRGEREHEPERTDREQRRAEPDRRGHGAAGERAQRRGRDSQEAHRRGHAAEQSIGRDGLAQRQVLDAEHHAAEVEQQHREAEREGRDPHRSGDEAVELPRDRRRGERVHDHRPHTVAGREAFGRRRRHHAAEAAEHVGEADRAGRQSELARREQDQHRELRVVQELPQPGEPGERRQRRVAAHELQPLGDLVGDAGPRARMRHVARHAQVPQHQRRDQERDRVDEDRERRGQRLDQEAGDAGADQRRAGLAERDLRVGLDQPPASRHLREQHLVGRAADDVLDTAEEADRVEHLDREPAGERRHRDGRERERAAHVGDDDDRQLADPVDQHARVQREQRERKRLERDQHPHLERRGVQHQRRRQRQREVGDLRAERRDRQRQPHAPEVGRQPQAGEPAAEAAS